MAFDREAARQAGYSDEEINAYLEEERNKKKEPAPTPMAQVGEPPAPTTVVPEAGGGVAGGATTAGLAVAPYIVPAAGAAAAALGGSKLYGAWKQGATAAQNIAAAQQAQAAAAAEQAAADRLAAQGLQQRFEARMAGQGAQAFRPPVTPTYNVPTAAMPQVPGVAPSVAPAAGPVAPAGMPAAAAPAQAAEASLLDKTTAVIRQLAANKVLQGVAKGGAGVAAALTPGNIGQNYNFPTSGPYKGMEINPMTGRPWTPQELAQYR